MHKAELIIAGFRGWVCLPEGVYMRLAGRHHRMVTGLLFRMAVRGLMRARAGMMGEEMCHLR